MSNWINRGAVARPYIPLSVKNTFSALKYPNYRLWFIGQLVSLVGTWMQTTAQGYLVFELTRSPAFLGYVSFAAGMPAWMFTLYAGVISDRMSRRTLLVITQTAMMLLALILAALVFTGAVQPWHIVLLAMLLGIANAFDAPARQAFVVELVSREDMTNAIALNSTMFNSGTVVGPAVAGIVYALVGPAWCFTINGLTFLAVIAALLLMKLEPIVAPPPKTSTLIQLKDGISFVRANKIVALLVANMSVVSMFGMSMMTLIPAWAVTILKGDVTTNGILLSARGLGALLGALMVASLSRHGLKGRLWTIGSVAMPAALLLFALLHWLPLSLLLLVLLGWSFMLVANTSNALVQTQVPDELRGRVMSIYTLTFFGAMPLGSLLIGELADRLTEPLALMISAAMLFIVAALIWARAPGIRKLE